MTRRQLLRTATRTAHEALDAQVGGFDTLQDYQRYLAGIARFRLPVEAGLRSIAMPAALGDWQPTFVSEELKRDLAHFEFETPSDTPLSEAPDESTLYGILYVLEGSGLGARLLARRATELGLTAETGASHLFAQARNNQVWQEFMTALENAEAFEEDVAVAAANETFRLAERAFTL